MNLNWIDEITRKTIKVGNKKPINVDKNKSKNKIKGLEALKGKHNLKSYSYALSAINKAKNKIDLENELDQAIFAAQIGEIKKNELSKILYKAEEVKRRLGIKNKVMGLDYSKK